MNQGTWDLSGSVDGRTYHWMWLPAPLAEQALSLVA